MKKNIEDFLIFFLIFFAFFTRFWNLHFPPKVIFDEAHHAFFAQSYLVGRYFFDTHPPLGKLLFALAGFLAKTPYSPDCNFKFFLGSEYQDFKYLALRSVTAIAGSFLILIVYLFVKEMGFSKRAAFLASSLVLFDNAFLIQSRLILLDILMVFFIFLTLYLFILARKSVPFSKKWYFLNFLTGFSLGCAISIKWPALATFLLIWLTTLTFDSFFKKPLKEKIMKFFFLFLLPIGFYILFFFIHFSLFKFTCPISHYEILLKTYYSTTFSLPNVFNKIPDKNFLQKFVTTNYYMMLVSFTENDFFANSPWWSWPFMIRPVAYFFERENGKIRVMYFLGNPIAWSLGIIGILSLFILLLRKLFVFLKKGVLLPPFFPEIFTLVCSGYLIFLLPFSFTRSVPIYYYLPSLLFSFIIFAVLFDQLLEITLHKKEAREMVYFFLLILILIGFIIFLPFSYGWSIG